MAHRALDAEGMRTPRPYLWVLQQNQQARVFYESLGARRGSRKLVEGPGEAPYTKGKSVVTIDPVAQAEAYRQLMFDLAGPGDPSAAMEGMPAAVRRLLQEAGDRLRVRPGAGEWSPIELLGHMLDAELVNSTRLRWIISQNRPALPGWEQDDWVAALRYNDADPESLLQPLEALRVTNV